MKNFETLLPRLTVRQAHRPGKVSRLEKARYQPPKQWLLSALVCQLGFKTRALPHRFSVDSEPRAQSREGAAAQHQLDLQLQVARTGLVPEKWRSLGIGAGPCPEVSGLLGAEASMQVSRKSRKSSKDINR